MTQGIRPPWREYLHGEHTLLDQSMQWLTDGREKYVWLSGSGREQLFDLVADPAERQDLALSPQHAHRARPWRSRMVEVLSGREEGYVVDGDLVAGRPVLDLLSTAAPWKPS